MRHLGDITKINGDCIPIVDCITGGSPCQDLSTAGTKKGLKGKRSGLFIEQIRIVKEMRKRDETENGRTAKFTRPRWMVWENVTGATSSNGGQIFRPSSLRSSESHVQIVPLCLCLRKEGGLKQDAYMMNWVTGALLGEYTLPSFGEQPNTLTEECYPEELHRDVAVSRLSQILEDSPHQRYYLSEKACLGLISRANRKGKKLPKQMEMALIHQATRLKSEEDARRTEMGGRQEKEH